MLYMVPDCTIRIVILFFIKYKASESSRIYFSCLKGDIKSGSCSTTPDTRIFGIKLKIRSITDRYPFDSGSLCAGSKARSALEGRLSRRGVLIAPQFFLIFWMGISSILKLRAFLL